MNEIIKFLKKRRSVTAKKMLPGKVTESDLNDILECALRVPDHGALSPWKLVVIQNDMRKTIGEEILEPEFKKNNTDFNEEKLLFEKNRFLRADKIIAVIYSPVDSQKFQLGNDAFYWSCLSKYNYSSSIFKLCSTMGY